MLTILLLFTLPALGAPSPADQKKLAEAWTLYQSGAYTQALTKAGGIQSSDRETLSTAAFFLALTHAKMQNYDKAIPHFKKAEELKNDAPSLHYEFGQALIALQELPKAETQFKKSIVNKFKMGASAYYVAYIRQLLGDDAGAKDFYSRIQKLANDADNVKQPALYQLAELEAERIGEEQNKEKRLRALQREALPLYKKAKAFASGTATAEQAEVKIREIETQVAEIVERMRNGIPYPRQAYTLRLSQDFTYDTNVITEADEALVEVSDKDALISKTGVLAKYQWNWRRTWSFIPELNATLTYHSRRDTATVYQNDNLVLAPAFRTKYEHTSRGAPASALLDLEYNYMMRDYTQNHELPYYSRYWNLVLGERVKWFNTGTTTLKASIKLYEHYDPARNSYSPQLSLQQNIKLFSKWDLSNTFTADYLHARDDTNDERNYKLAHSVTLLKLFEKVDVTPSLTLNLKDTMKQKNTRGNELLINPSVGLTREFANRLDGSFDYSYSKNQSKSKTLYQYTKHEFKLGVSYSF